MMANTVDTQWKSGPSDWRGPCVFWVRGKDPQGTCEDLLESDSFPGGSDSKESTCNPGDLASIPGLERSPGEGNGFDPCVGNITPVFWPRELPGERSLAGYRP